MHFSNATIKRFWSKVAVAGPNDCWEWKGWKSSPGGYGKFDLRGKKLRAHRVAFAITNGSFFPSLKLCHSCDNPPCCNPAHLFLGTTGDNQADAENKGRWIKKPSKPKPPPKPKYHFPIGEKHHNAKLVPSDILEICELAKMGLCQRAIAKRFHVSQRNVCSILQGKSWSHVTGRNRFEKKI